MPGDNQCEGWIGPCDNAAYILTKSGVRLCAKCYRLRRDAAEAMAGGGA